MIFLYTCILCFIFTEKAGQYHRAELLTDGIRLCLLDLRILSDHHNHKVYCFYEHTVANENINFIDVNMKANEVYFSTNTSIYRVAINNTRNSPAVKLATAPGDKAQGHITGRLMMTSLGLTVH